MVAEFEDDIQVTSINQIGAQERARIKNARIAFEEIHPQPVFSFEPFEEEAFTEPDFNKEFGSQAIAMRIAVFGSAAISAITVGLILFVMAANTDAVIAEDSGNAILQWMAGIIPSLFFVLGFGAEAYAYSHGLAAGKEAKEIEFSNASLFAVFAIMGSAGLYRAFGLVDEPAPGSIEAYLKGIMTLLTIISTGIGFPALVYFGAKNLGVFNNKFAALVVQREQDHRVRQDNKYQDWLTRRELKHQEYLQDLDEWQKELKKYFDKEFAGQVLMLERGTVRAPRAKKQQENPETDANNGKSGVTDAIRNYLRREGLYPSQVGGDERIHRIAPGAVANDLGFPASIKKNMSNYISRLFDEETRDKANGIDWLTGQPLDA